MTHSPLFDDLRTQAARLPLAHLEASAVAIARAAGELVVRDRPDRSQMGINTKSTDTDVVTVMDQAAQDLIRQQLAQRHPGDAVWGEEEGETEGSSPITWVVDPIDGTVNYLYDIPAFAISIAAVVGDPRTPGAWLPIAGCVLNPRIGECYSATVGGGARKTIDQGEAGPGRSVPQPTSLTVREPASLAEALLATGFGYDARKRVWQAQIVTGLIGQVRDIRRMGSAALDLCHVADGQLNAYYECGLNAWDFAAGWLIASEAGAQVSGGAGRAPSGELLIAAPPRTAATLEAALNEVMVDNPGPTPAGP